MSSQEEKLQRVELLRQIITERRTIRNFTEKFPPRNEIEQIIKAGILAPYSILGTTREEDFRKFHVFKKDSSPRLAIQQMLIDDAKKTARLSQTRRSQEKTSYFDGIEYTHSIPARTREQARDLLYQYYMQKGHLEAMLQAPYLIIITEKRRGPLLSNHVDRQSIAHCMQNMWLMSSALGLGFQPLSALAYLTKNPEFCRIIQCKTGQFEMDGFLLGYPSEHPGPNPKEFQPEKIIRWYE